MAKRKNCDIKRTVFFTGFLCWLCLCLIACQASGIDQQITQTRLQPKVISAAPFQLQSYLSNNVNDQPLVIYIEGDGFAWRNRSQPSTSPTPHNPVALQLAMLDARPNIAYLARPCQYLQSSVCDDNKWWTGARFSEPVIAAMNTAIDQLKNNLVQPIELIGFSGGGAVAVAIAARRHDVIALRTVAGNLNPRLVNELHDVTAMPDTVDPIRAATAIKNIPQIHYRGAADEIIPAQIADSYRDAADNSLCIAIRTVANATHNDGWADAWPTLLQQTPVCN